MTVSSILDKTLNDTLEKLRTQPNYRLSPSQRLEIYRAFGPSNRPVNFVENYHRVLENQLTLSVADLILANLAILTAWKVMPVWEIGAPNQEDLAYDPKELPKRILNQALGLVDKSLTPAEVSKTLNEEYEPLLSALGWDVTYEVYAALVAAASALSVTLFGLHNLEDKCRKHVDDDISPQIVDFASWAIKAYSGTDRNAPGEWLVPKESLQKIEYNAVRRLEFWEWWLTEAIPEAWELAQTFTGERQ